MFFIFICYWLFSRLADGVDVTFFHNEICLAFPLDFCAGIFAVKNGVFDFYRHRLIPFARTNSDYSAFLWFFFIALNDGITSAIISFLRLIVFEIGFLFILPYFFGGDAIFVSTGIACLLTDIISFIFIIVYKNKYGY